MHGRCVRSVSTPVLSQDLSRFTIITLTMTCGEYHRGWRAMVLIHDTLSTRLLEKLGESMATQQDRDRLARILAQFRSDDRNVRELGKSPDFRWMCTALADFRRVQSEMSGDFKYVSLLLDAIGSVVHMWRCFRYPTTYGFEEQLRSMQNLMPLFFATGRVVYARIIPYLVEQLRSTPVLMPSFYRDVLKRGHGLAIPRNTFFPPPDLIHEQVGSCGEQCFAHAVCISVVPLQLLHASCEWRCLLLMTACC